MLNFVSRASGFGAETRTFVRFHYLRRCLEPLSQDKWMPNKPQPCLIDILQKKNNNRIHAQMPIISAQNNSTIIQSMWDSLKQWFAPRGGCHNGLLLKSLPQWLTSGKLATIWLIPGMLPTVVHSGEVSLHGSLLKRLPHWRGLYNSSLLGSSACSCKGFHSCWWSS